MSTKMNEQQLEQMFNDCLVSVNKPNREQLAAQKGDFGQWVVTSDSLETNDGRYVIEFNRLKENWITHLLNKSWCDMNSFLKAYRFALLKNNLPITKVNWK